MIYHGGSDETWADSDFEEEEEEALSLCDLPTIDDSENPSREESPKAIEESQEEEFNFCSWSQDQSLNETELCAAEDIFFQGQIVPMGKFAIKQICNQNERISIIVEEPIMDHNCSSGGFTSTESSSRSSSLNSTSTSPTIIENKLPKTRVSNQFRFSHPSPKPHVRSPSSTTTTTTTKNGYFSSNPNSRSGSWTLFRVGLVATPEIGIQDLKARNNCKRSNGTGSHNNNNNKNEKKDKKKERSLFNKKGVLFSSCKCSASVIGTVNSASIVMKEEHHHHHYAKEEDKEKEKQKQKEQRAGKQSFSRHRTFEWLKQLSLETATDEF